jgi:nitrogen fixation NifU-like protein
MSELRELYQQLIIDHGRQPRNFGPLDNADIIKEGYNPLCGDRLTIYMTTEDDCIKEVMFEGVGCAISVASASLMTQALKGKRIAEADKLFDAFHELIMGNDYADNEDLLGKLIVLAGVAEFPARVKCATLCWHTLRAAMHHSEKEISTE